MFLWVQYMLKELKSCVSIQQVQGKLQALPKGLDLMYQRILQRLQDTLDKQTLSLCSKVLAWVTNSLVGDALDLPMKQDSDQPPATFEYRRTQAGFAIPVPERGAFSVIHGWIVSILRQRH